MFMSVTDSLGEQIQRAFPNTHVVKALNSMWVGVMTNPRVLSRDSTVFLAGNSAEGKAQTDSILKQFGWKDSEILNVGDIAGARGLEALLLIWLRIYTQSGNGAFNFKIVR